MKIKNVNIKKIVEYILGILLTIIILWGIYLILRATNVIDYFTNHNFSDTSEEGNSSNRNFVINDALVGTYKWSKSYTNEHGNKINLKVTLVLNDDGTAFYEAGDGYAYEATKGTYTFENNKIIYTKEYYDYPNQEQTKYGENEKVETFNVIDNDTLQNTFSNELTELRKQEKITNEMLVGTYRWNKSYTNEHGNKINLKVTLVLNSDGTAAYEAGDGYAYEATKGAYVFKNGKVIYTREYYNYPNQESTKFEESNKMETFEIINKTTLQNTFNNQLTELRKQDNVTKETLVGTYKWSKTYTNEHGDKINLKVILVLNSDDTAIYEASDGHAYEATKGTYVYENGKVIYTREYYNYPNQESTKFEESNKIEIFEVLDKKFLQNTFNDQLTELRKQDKITKEMLLGTYNWNKTYTNEHGDKINLKVTLVLNSDGTATYEASDGHAYEATKGTYKYDNIKIIYTREYYNYPNQESTKFDDENHKVEIFEIVNKNTLQNTFNDFVTELKK